MHTLRLLIVDDDLLNARVLKANLDRPGKICTEVVGSGEEALQAIRRQPVHAIVTDLYMPGMSGIDLVHAVREMDRSLPIIVMTANATLEGAVDVIRAGATEFLQKPINIDALVALLERAHTERPLREEIEDLRERRGQAGADLIVGKHPRLEAVRQFAKDIAAAQEARVLITGESGTGKSLLARAIHNLSGAKGRFVEVNCAALPANLLESELFGHEKGAFSDAKALKRGLIETADRGTILLDEIDTLSLDLQAKLLLFLETREIRRVGGVESIPIRTRVITATNSDLRRRVRDGAFREDLFYRIHVASVEMPALRTIPSTIPELGTRFVHEVAAELHRPVPELAEQSFAALAHYDWPGNVRELRNAVERALIFLQPGETLIVLPPAPIFTPSPRRVDVELELGLTLQEVECRYLEATLSKNDQQLADVADSLGISRKTLWEKRRRYGL